MSQDWGKDPIDSSTSARQGHNTKTFDSPFKADPKVDDKRDDPVRHFVARGHYLDGSMAAGRKSGHRCLCRLCGRSICGGAKAAKEHFSKSEKFRCEATTPVVWYAIWSNDMTKCPKEFASAIKTLQSFLPGHPSLQRPPLRFPEDAVPPPVPGTATSGPVASPNSGAPAIRVTIARPATTVATRPAAPPSAPLAATRGARDVEVGRSAPANEPPPVRNSAGSEAFNEESVRAFFESRRMPFNSSKLESFKRMFTMIIPPGVSGAAAPRLPSYHMLRTTLLDELDGEVQKCVRPVLDTSRETGCTIMTDGWTNIRGQTLYNYLVGTEIGVVYVATDVMRDKKDASALANAWLKRVKSMDIQLSDITTFVTDSSGVNVATMKVFQKDESVKHIFWIPCVTHVMDLVLEDIGKINWVASRIAQARLVTRFFKRHGHAREVFEAHSTKTLLLPAETRFDTNVIMMDRLVELRAALTDVVGNDRWRETVWSTSKICKDTAEVTACIGSPPWWEDLRALCKMLEPIIDMLKLADSDTRQISKILRWYEEMIASCLSAYRDIDRDQQDAIVEVFIRRRTMFKTPAHTAVMLLDPEFRDATLCDDADVQQALVEALVQFSYLEGSPQHREVQRAVAKLHMREPLFVELTMRRVAHIFDHPASFWSSKKGKFPHTAVFAGRILHIWTTASPCERAWSRWSFIHSRSLATGWRFLGLRSLCGATRWSRTRLPCPRTRWEDLPTRRAGLAEEVARSRRGGPPVAAQRSLGGSLEAVSGDFLAQGGHGSQLLSDSVSSVHPPDEGPQREPHRGPADTLEARPLGVIHSDGGEGVSQDTAQPGSADGGRSFGGGIERRGSSTAHPSIVRPSTHWHDVGDGHTDEPRPHLMGMHDIMCPPPSRLPVVDPAAHGQAAPSALPMRSFYDGAGMDRKAGDMGQTSTCGPADVPAGARSIGNVNGTCHDSMRAYEEQHGRPIRAKTTDVHDTRMATARLSRARKKGTGVSIPYHRRRPQPFFRNRDKIRQMSAAADGQGGPEGGDRVDESGRGEKRRGGTIIIHDDSCTAAEGGEITGADDPDNSDYVPRIRTADGVDAGGRRGVGVEALPLSG
ncbi:hypothetical protein CBR_g50358 [Chara braunii]|uniref:DUF659 domain-containing protein n=1 Tax=Chara braunii TaxID=69332 RepID=A0A388K5J8_CHABU|nr:hypothetical protein CBR_g50358 [Chara braunii]|eukprot:GBG65321.1 hypothetical protein CBR_g50358 [Chara braunii]